jgi:hypothetical protein
MAVKWRELKKSVDKPPAFGKRWTGGLTKGLATRIAKLDPKNKA